MATPPPLSIAAHLPSLHRGIFHACLCVTGFFLSLHALYWLPAVPLPLAGWIGTILWLEFPAFQGLTFLSLGLLVAVWVPVVPAAVASSWVRQRVVQRVSLGAGLRKWALAPWLHSVGWLAITLGHVGLDIDPALSLAGYAGLALLLPETRRGLAWSWRAMWRRLVALPFVPARGVPPSLLRLDFVPAAVVVGWVWLGAASGPFRLASLVAWGAVLFFAHGVLGRFVVLRDRLAFAVFSLVGIQLLLALAPIFRIPPGAEVLGAGAAYSFVECEGRLFASVPRCARNEVELCRARSMIDAFFWTGERFMRTHRLRFFSPEYAGRAEKLACVEGRVEVGMGESRHGQEASSQGLFEFDAADPERFAIDVLGPGAGERMAIDPGRRRVYYTSEHAGMILRDLATGVQEPVTGVLSAGGPVDLGYHAGRDSLLALLAAGPVTELDAGSHELVAEHDILNGREFSLDEARERAYVAGNWGFEVVDLAQGRVVARHRIGLGGRQPALDPCHHVIYVATTAAGRLHAFDRASLRPLGSVALGIGPRHAYVSRDGRWLIAGSAAGHYVWDAGAMASRLRGGSPPSDPPAPGCAIERGPAAP